MKNAKQKIFIIAGEASGDIIGGKLISALKKSRKDIEFMGVGGTNMISAGLKNIFAMHDLSIMGYLEVIPAIPRIYKRIKECIRSIIESKPDILITIDSPGFNFRVAQRIRVLFGNRIKIVHYVAPSVWAYKPERVYKVAKIYDHLLMILPFEKEYFDAHLPCTYVGHPIIEQELRPKNSPSDIRKKFKIKANEKLITLMPGSRKGEVKKHLEVFLNAIEIIRKIFPVRIFIPTVKNIEYLLPTNLPNCIISSDPETKRHLISSSDVALIKSGTSSVEMIGYKIPTVVGYRMNTLTYLYLKNKLKVKYASLANIVLDKELVPEFIQSKCTPENLSSALLNLLQSPLAREKQLVGFSKIARLFKGSSNKLPSEQAALVILKMLAN